MTLELNEIHIDDLYKLLQFESIIDVIEKEHHDKIDNIQLLFDRKVDKLQKKETMVDSFIREYCKGQTYAMEINESEVASYKNIISVSKKLKKLHQLIEQENNVDEVMHFNNYDLLNKNYFDSDQIVKYLSDSTFMLFDEVEKIEEKRQFYAQQRKDIFSKINRNIYDWTNSIESFEKKFNLISENIYKFSNVVTSKNNIGTYDFQRYVNFFENLFNDSKQKWNNGQEVSFQLFSVNEQNSKVAITAINSFNELVEDSFLLIQKKLKALNFEGDKDDKSLSSSIDYLKSVIYSVDNNLNVFQVNLNNYKKVLEFYCNRSILFKEINRYRTETENKTDEWESKIKDKNSKSLINESNIILDDIIKMIKNKTFFNKDEVIKKSLSYISNLQLLNETLSTIELNSKVHLDKLEYLNMRFAQEKIELDKNNVCDFITEWISSEIKKTKLLRMQTVKQREEITKLKIQLSEKQKQVEDSYDAFLREENARKKKKKFIVMMLMFAVICAIAVFFIVTGLMKVTG